MKTIPFLMSILLFLLGTSFIKGQDLIERTQRGMILDEVPGEKTMAYLESQSMKRQKAYEVIRPFQLAEFSKRQSVQQYVDGHVMLDIPKGMLPRLMKSMDDAINLRIPVDQQHEIELDLVEVFPLSSDFVGHLSDGRTFTKLDYPVRFYRGAIVGVPNSFAAVTVADNMFRALVGDDYGNYVLAELDGKDDEFVLYNDRKLKMENNFSCGVESAPYEDEVQDLLRSPTRVDHMTRGDDCVEVMVEMEEDFYDDWNNVTSANNFIYSLFNEVAMLYNNENISIALKDVIMWTTPDPYTNTDLCSSTNDLLDEFADERQNNYNGRLAHLITSRNVGGGCAFVDVLCHTYTNSLTKSQHAVSGGMSTSVTAFPTYSWNVMVFTHEMGHNLGSRHTHACVWNGNNTAIDGCSTPDPCANPGIPAGGGTIMSYCHQQAVGINFNLGFGTQPGNLIRGEVAGASCTLDCGTQSGCPRYIYLDGNIDADTYYADIKAEVGGTVSNGVNVQVRSEGNTELNPGFRVNNGGIFGADYATCTAARTATTEEGPVKENPDEELNSNHIHIKSSK